MPRIRRPYFIVSAVSVAPLIRACTDSIRSSFFQNIIFDIVDFCPGAGLGLGSRV